MQSAVEYNKIMIPVAKPMDSGVYICRVADVPQDYSASAVLDVVASKSSLIGYLQGYRWLQDRGGGP